MHAARSAYIFLDCRDQSYLPPYHTKHARISTQTHFTFSIKVHRVFFTHLPKRITRARHSSRDDESDNDPATRVRDDRKYIRQRPPAVTKRRRRLRLSSDLWSDDDPPWVACAKEI